MDVTHPGASRHPSYGGDFGNSPRDYQIPSIGGVAPTGAGVGTKNTQSRGGFREYPKLGWVRKLRRSGLKNQQYDTQKQNTKNFSGHPLDGR
jgi:hypothetical protein